MASEKNLTLGSYVEDLIEKQQSVNIYLSSGVRLHGRIVAFDLESGVIFLSQNGTNPEANGVIAVNFDKVASMALNRG